MERITHPGGRLEIKRRLPGGALISYTRSADGQPAGKTTRYLHMDHLGSIDIISNEIGQLVARMSFDPWGQRRDPLNWGPLVDKALSELETNITGITKRGFTGHEMLDEVGLIHMNGRIYDPRLGRFMQADPIIDGVTDTQGYNRYSYVHNNPLNATDPSGFSTWNSFRDNLLKPVIQAIVTAYCIPCGAALAAATAVYYGGSFADAAIAAFTTAVMANMGQEFAANGFGATEALAFGYVGGITSALRGGKFGHGFVSAYAGAAVNASGILEGASQVEQFGANVVIAGTISEATGGKFANGAATAAFLFALREASNFYEKIVGYELDMGPGGNAVEKGPLGKPVEGANNIGTQNVWKLDKDGRRIVGTFEEGGLLSKFANKIPGINATAGVHDVMQVSMGTGLARDALNVPGMIAAGGLTYAAYVSQPLQSLNAQQLIYLSVAASHDDDDQRQIHTNYAAGAVF